jgi:phenylalanyl-tRNA synthetase beta chain
LEVEETKPVAPPFSGVVVGEIVDAVQHPNADRLRVCQVNVGLPELLTIVCGAPNARPGIRVPCARVGAELQGESGEVPFRISLSKLRGIESEGMLCSAKELKLSDDQLGLLELGGEAPLGVDLRAYLGLDDVLFTLKLTPNLAHCLSIFGVARELSALTGTSLKAPIFSQVTPIHDERLPVTVLDSDLCGRFSGRVIRGINPQARTPRWMVDRLSRCGQRSVNALVDISNYVMFEFGRPTHIFDLDRIHGGLEVRWARQDESLKLLNGNVVELDSQVGVIADERQVESLAGIMGGDSTAVSDETRNVYVEAAFWWPKAVAGRSRRYGFSTDAGHRFERGVDPQLTVEHIEYITGLILGICGGEAGPVDDQQPNMPQAIAVPLRVARAAKVIGMPLSVSQCIGALTGLGLDVESSEDDVLSVIAPSYRFDIQVEEDLIEEIARVVGYVNLPDTPPLAPVTAKVTAERLRNPYSVRRQLATLGYQETINFSFVEEAWEREIAGNENPIRLLNPIASQMSVMRSSLFASLMNVAKFNLDRKAERVCIFEVGRVFLRDPAELGSDTAVAGFSQPMRVAGLLLGISNPMSWEGKGKPFDFFDVKGHVESLFGSVSHEFANASHPAMHPGRCAAVTVGGRVAGYVGELHPKWRQSWDMPQAPMLFELDLNAILVGRVPSYHPFSKFQAVERDLAIWVPDGTSHAALMTAIRSAPVGGVLRAARLFDVYKPTAQNPEFSSHRKSLAVRITLKRDDTNLNDVEIDAAIQTLLQHLGQILGAQLRT